MIQTVIERYTADPQEVTAAGERAANRYFGLYQTLEPAVYVKAIDFGVTITGRVLVQARGRRLTTSKIWQDLLTELNKTPHVDLAYPTTRFYRADLEPPRPHIT